MKNGVPEKKIIQADEFRTSKDWQDMFTVSTARVEAATTMEHMKAESIQFLEAIVGWQWVEGRENSSWVGEVSQSSHTTQELEQREGNLQAASPVICRSRSQTRQELIDLSKD